MTAATLEICVDDAHGVTAALAGGADRIELCAALALGGLTPSAGLVDHARRVAGGRGMVHAMVRPRAGDFVYDEVDTAVAAADAAALLSAGVDGLVFGATRGGRLDHALLSAWIATVRAIRPGVALTLHRAIDTLADPLSALAEARSLGFDRVLTSGGAGSAMAGAPLIARMVAAARDTGPIVAVGAGLRADTLETLARQTGTRHFHASAGQPVEEERGAAALGFARPPRRATMQPAVRALRDAIDRIDNQED